jgi:protein-tyrosine phosphatase
MPLEEARGGWIDLHCHILPGVDDGAVDFEEAVAMCQQAAARGCRAMIATPHLRHAQWFNDDREALVLIFDELRRRTKDVIDLYLGGEIAVNSASAEELFELPEGELLTLAGSRYLLLEPDWQGFGPDILELVHELVLRDFRPIIAHPERVQYLADNPPLLHDLVERGACLQLTAMSLTGELGPRIRRLCEQLLAANLVHFVASDAHNLELRPPGLERAHSYVLKRFGDDLAQRLFVTYPRAVVDDVPLSSEAPC